MEEHQDKPNEELEQKVDRLQGLYKTVKHAGIVGLYVVSLLYLGSEKFGKFMANVDIKSHEEARKGTYVFSRPLENARESYFRAEEKYGILSTNPLGFIEVSAKGLYMGAIGNLVMIEYGIRQLKK